MPPGRVNGKAGEKTGARGLDVDARDVDPLFAPGVPGDQADGSAPDAECTSEHLRQLPIRRSLDGSRTNADPEAVTLNTVYAGPSRPRGDAHPDDDAVVRGSKPARLRR
jgi:hypothetical protein